MRCSCPQCQTYMVQDEKGMNSACVCPACFFRCSACMGTEGVLPLSAEALRAREEAIQGFAYIRGDTKDELV